MYLQKLSLWNFKNYQEQVLDFGNRVNVFVGKNGSGKTNVLDAIYFLALTKSAFASVDSYCIKHGENFFTVKGQFMQSSAVHEILVSLQQGARKVFKDNGVEYEKLSEHIGRFPIVLIAPDDSEIVKEGSELRRRFFDGIISQLDKRYLDQLIRYGQALKNRNALLKIFSESGKVDHLALESYDRILIHSGDFIYTARQNFIREFLPVFKRHYSFLVEDVEETNITYVSQIHELDYGSGLAKSKAKDFVLQRTNFGIHKDDFEFELHGGELKRLGSQGQQKSFVIALKLAQFEMIKSIKGFPPILLLDDIFDKLDDLRIDKLLSLIINEEVQLFITDARPHRTTELLKAAKVQTKVFRVEAGVVTLEENQGV